VAAHFTLLLLTAHLSLLNFSAPAHLLTKVCSLRSAPAHFSLSYAH
jgi:hypothetical protein